MTTHFCDDASKMAFSSVRSARKSLTGQLKSKRIRVYPCPQHPEHFHVTKEGSTRLHEHHA